MSTIKCSCSQSYCCNCNKEAHAPAACTDVEELHCFDELMGAYRSLEAEVTVRPCPNCKVAWEKMWGCNHMTCPCGTSFCWGCGGKHEDSSAFCGNITVPLEKKRIVPLPSEKIAMTRIEAFELFLTWKLKPLSTREQTQLDRVISRRAEDHNVDEIVSWCRRTTEYFNSVLTFFRFSLICKQLKVRDKRKLQVGVGSLSFLAGSPKA